MRPLLRGPLLLALSAMLLLLAHPARPSAQASRPLPYVPDELVIQLRRPLLAGAAGAAPRAAEPAVDGLLRRFGVSAAEPLVADGSAAEAAGLTRIYRLRLAAGVEPRAAAWAFAADPNVAFAEPNYIYRAGQDVAPPNDRGFPLEWGLNNTGQTRGTADADIDALEAWTITTGSSDLMVAVIDTGIDYTHPDLDDGRVRTDIDYDFANRDADAMDDNKHGTHVAGTIAAETFNGIGVAGVMWDAQLLPVKVLSGNGAGTLFTVARGIAYAASVGARVLNMSLGGPICAQAMASAINYAHFTQGAVVVAAAGNESGPVSYPGRFPAVITVAASDHNDARASFSNFGPQVDVAAPGVDILSTTPGGRYEIFDGTSMASPHVAGVAGLLLAQRPELANTQVAEILRLSADDRGRPGPDQAFGAGRVNAHQALLTEPPQTVPAPPPASCGRVANLVLADGPDGESLAALASRFRDDVVLASPYGRGLAERFDGHASELLRMLLADGALRDQTRRTMHTLRPALAALTGDGPEQTVSAEMVDALQGLIAAYAAQASPALRADLNALAADITAADLAGRPASAAWSRLAQVSQVFLPLLQR